jgi:endoribonuclease Dicer
MSKKEFLRKFENSTVIIVISQMFLNCLRRGFVKLTDFSFIVFDECHHCKGDHPYAGIMNEFYFDIKAKIKKGKNIDKNENLPKIMGLTASPIPDPEMNQKKLEKMIEELCINMDSNFVEYPKNEEKNQTEIKIIEIKESE